MRVTEFARTKLQGGFCQTPAMDVSQRRRTIHATRRRANRIRDDKEPKSVVRELAAV